MYEEMTIIELDKKMIELVLADRKKTNSDTVKIPIPLDKIQVLALGDLMYCRSNPPNEEDLANRVYEYIEKLSKHKGCAPEQILSKLIEKCKP